MLFTSKKGYHPELLTVWIMSKHVPSQLEFSKFTAVDDSFCLGLTSPTKTYFLLSPGND